MRQVWSKVSSCRRSAADCSCGILVCGKSAAKFHPAADLPQTVPVAYWYAASLQQNFFLPHTSAYSLPQTFSLRQVCGRSAAYFSLSYGTYCVFHPFPHMVKSLSHFSDTQRLSMYSGISWLANGFAGAGRIPVYTLMIFIIHQVWCQRIVAFCSWKLTSDSL